MVIHLTKALADKLKMSPTKAESVNEFSSWRAHYVQGTGYRFVVFMNDASRFTIVVNDAKAAKLKKLPEMFTKVLVDTLYSLNVNPDVIGCYLEELGNKIIYTKNADRKKTAQLNKHTEAALWALEEFYSDVELSLYVNKMIFNITGKDERVVPKRKMLEFLGKYGLPVIKCAAFDLNVRLLLGGDGVDAIRRLRVPANISFEHLHLILQTAFGWQNYHLYCFGMLKEWDINCYHRPEVKLVSCNEDLEYDPDAILMGNVKLIDYMCKYKKIIYIYDYGDGWLHQIEVENLITDCQEELPILLSGEGDSPPEDVGGADGYADFLEIINNPKHEDYEEMKSWAEGQRWNLFDYEKTARMVRYYHG
jgi:hypothetical protein